MAKADLTAARLREILHYDPETGAFTWLVNRQGSSMAKRGEPAGCVADNGYVLMTIDGRAYRAHRLAWLFMTGQWPINQIDHRLKGYENRANNRFENLREASNKQNNENRVLDSRNQSGFRGISWDKVRGKWYAHITHNYKMISLGRHESLTDAVAARIRAERSFFTHAQTCDNNSR